MFEESRLLSATLSVIRYKIVNNNFESGMYSHKILLRKKNIRYVETVKEDSVKEYKIEFT